MNGVRWSRLKPNKPRIGRVAQSVAAALICFGALGVATAVRAEAPTGVYTYTVHNDRFGEVGVYINVVRREGSTIIVENRTEIAIKFLFVTVFHFSATTTAVWERGRIVRYEGFTDDDGKTSEVRARADGEQLVIDGAAGRVVVPAGVYPQNPWNIGILGARAIMSPKSGRLFPAKISGGGAEDVERAGEILKTVAYRIDTDRSTWVWYDGDDVPVKFVMERKRGRELLTFTLVGID